jgi:hypothetical protein
VNAAGTTWTAGVNSKFVGMTLGQAASLCGTITSGPRKAKALAAMDAWPGKVLPASAIPAAYNVIDAHPQCANVTGHIRDQRCVRAGMRGVSHNRYLLTRLTTALPSASPHALMLVTDSALQRVRLVLGVRLHGGAERPHVHRPQLHGRAVRG